MKLLMTPETSCCAMLSMRDAEAVMLQEPRQQIQG